MLQSLHSEPCMSLVAVIHCALASSPVVVNELLPLSPPGLSSLQRSPNKPAPCTLSNHSDIYIPVGSTRTEVSSYLLLLSDPEEEVWPLGEVYVELPLPLL